MNALPSTKTAANRSRERQPADDKSGADAEHRRACRGVGDEHDRLAIGPIDDRPRGQGEQEPRHGAGEDERSGSRRRARQGEDEERVGDRCRSRPQLGCDLPQPQEREVLVPAQRSGIEHLRRPMRVRPTAIRHWSPRLATPLDQCLTSRSCDARPGRSQSERGADGSTFAAPEVLIEGYAVLSVLRRR